MSKTNQLEHNEIVQANRRVTLDPSILCSLTVLLQQIYLHGYNLIPAK